MTSVNELIAIVPVILNLKGNIEMNLSARLGTASNMGDLDIPSIRNDVIFGNLALLQVQAAVVSFIAACFTFLLGVIIPGMGEESSDPSPADTRGLFRHHHPRIARQAHSLRRPRPSLPAAGVPRSGFNEYVSLKITALPSHPLTYCVDSWCSHRRPCQLPASPQFYWARSCASSSSFAGSSVVILVCSEFPLSLLICSCPLYR